MFSLLSGMYMHQMIRLVASKVSRLSVFDKLPSVLSMLFIDKLVFMGGGGALRWNTSEVCILDSESRVILNICRQPDSSTQPRRTSAS